MQAERPKLFRKVLSKYPDSPAVFGACYSLLGNVDDKLTATEARAWSAMLTKAARPTGPGWKPTLRPGWPSCF